MGTTTSLQMGLDDLLADLRHARRTGELGRLALLAFCDVRSWARQAGLTDVAEHSLAMFADQPHTSREAFLTQIDGLILELEQLRPSLCTPNLAVPFRRRQGNEQPQEASA